MGEEGKRGLESLNMSQEKEEEVIIRCFRTVDYLNDIAGEIIMDFLHNTTCPISRQVLRNSPETVALKSFEKAINILGQKIRKNNLQM